MCRCGRTLDDADVDIHLLARVFGGDVTVIYCLVYQGGTGTLGTPGTPASLSAIGLARCCCRLSASAKAIPRYIASIPIRRAPFPHSGANGADPSFNFCVECPALHTHYPLPTTSQRLRGDKCHSYTTRVLNCSTERGKPV